MPAREADTLTATVIVHRDSPSLDASSQALAELRKSADEQGYAFASGTFDLALDYEDPGLQPGQVALVASARVVAKVHAMGAAEGGYGPTSPAQGGVPHVYAREVGSGAGNCRCGLGLGDWIHTEAAPGVPIPEEMRRG